MVRRFLHRYRYEGNHRKADLVEATRLLGGWAAGPAKDTLVVPQWKPSVWEMIWAVGVWIELSTRRKLLR